MAVFTNEVIIDNLPLPVDTTGQTITVVQPTGTNLHVTVDGIVATTTGSGPTSATVTSVSVPTASTLLLVSNVSRRQAILHNNSADILYVKFGSGASSASFSYRLPAYAVLEVNTYAGDIYGIKSANTTNVLVTEI